MRALALLLLPGVLVFGCSDSPSASSGAPPVPAAQMPLPLKFSGVLPTLGADGPHTVMFQAQANSLSSDAELAQLQTLFKEKGQTALVDELQVTGEKGWVRFGLKVAYPIPVIRSTALPGGGRKVVFTAARPISNTAEYSDQIFINYPIGVIELTVGPDGKGEGRLLSPVQAMITKGEFDLKSYSGIAHHLGSIRMTPGK
ncbi:MAG: hypothetical protein ACHQPI_02175 [Thermoanaerobaculia bacterium]